MNEVDKLIDSLKRNISNVKQAQIRFVECVSVDWNNKTMTAKGSSDGVEYLDIALGFGYMDIKPAVGSLCLIGIIDGQDVAAFLINSENAELVEIKAQSIIYNNGKNAGLVNIKELTGKLNIIENDLQTLKQITNTWIPVPGDGGAALKTALSVWTGKLIKTTGQPEIEDTRIKH